MYRFKTEKEFEEEFGNTWMNIITNEWNEEMDYLFGREITYEDWNNIQTNGSFYKHWFGSNYEHKWGISKDMVTDRPLPESTQPINLLDYHGVEFQAAVNGKQIKGKITIEKWCGKPCVFLCQDVRYGTECQNKQGYKNSWLVDKKTYEEQLNYIQESFQNFKLLNKSIYVKESSNTEVCRPHSQGEPRGTTIGIHSKPITITRGSRFVGSEATNFYTGTKANQGKVSYSRIQSV